MSAIRDSPSIVDLARVGLAVTRSASFGVLDRARPPRVNTLEDVPARIEQLTPELLTLVLCTAHPGAMVNDVSFESGSSGTSVRGRIRIDYNTAGSEAGLPTTLFAKSTPTLVTRIANGMTGTAESEAGFYRHLRPHLELEAPHGQHCIADARTFRSLHLLEDLVATKSARFCMPTDTIDRRQAEQVVVQLATLHGAAARLSAIRSAPSWLRSYPQWWQRAITTANVRRYHVRGLSAADDQGITPARLRGQAAPLWQGFLRSVDAHDRLPGTLIHGDVHLGNWYVPLNGEMGLCDWQCVSVGHWSRDLSYALAATLTIGQRRAWERELIAIYLESLGQTGVDIPAFAEVWRLYRQQLLAALPMWSMTHRPPRFMPEMQPQTMTREMIRRITTAIDDLESLDA